MVIAVSQTAARTKSAALAEAGVIPRYRIEYIGAKPDRGGAGQPQAFTVEMSPDQEVGVHYHSVAQYQVILYGDGRIGRHAVKTYAVHYTDEYTAYGPLVAGPGAMHYMTLRASGDPGPQYLSKPGVKEAIKPSRRRFLLGTDVLALGGEALARLTEPRIDPVLARHEDGVASLAMRLAPGMAARGPTPAEGGGHYFLVMSGALLHAGEELGPQSTLYVADTDEALTLQAGDKGAEVLFLQFPRKQQAAGAAS